MPGDITKVSVGRQHRQVVAETELRQQRIDGADLTAAASAFISQFGRIDMVAPVGNQQWQSGKPVEDLCAVPWSGETLQKFLQNEPGSHEFFARLDRTNQFAWLIP